MTPADFCQWQARMGLTVRAAAELLGVSPSTVQGWRTGISRRTGRPIEPPKMLALACAGLEAERAQAPGAGQRPARGARS